MKIKCPDCSTSYDIKVEALGPSGRGVKCARCGNRWHVSPQQEDEDPELSVGTSSDSSDQDEANWEADNAAEAETSAATSPDDSDSFTAQAAREPEDETAADVRVDEDDDKQADAPIDIETMAKRPKIKVNPNKFKRNRIGAILNWLMRRNYRRVAGMALFIAALAVCGSLILMRDGIVKKAPDLASLFEMAGFKVNLRGLEFRDLRTFREVEEGKPILVVEGSIHNIGEDVTPVPAVRLSIRGTDQQEIYAWTVEPRTKNLIGRDETRFRTILADPPEGASDIQVRFINRGLRQTALE